MVGYTTTSTDTYARLRDTASSMLAKFGVAAVLRGAGGYRPCTIFMMDFTAEDIFARQYDPVSRRVLMSTAGLAFPPSMEENIVTFVQPAASPPVVDKVLKILKPPTQIGPAGVTLVWDMVVR